MSDPYLMLSSFALWETFPKKRSMSDPYPDSLFYKNVNEGPPQKQPALGRGHCSTFCFAVADRTLCVSYYMVKILFLVYSASNFSGFCVLLMTVGPSQPVFFHYYIYGTFVRAQYFITYFLWC